MRRCAILAVGVAAWTAGATVGLGAEELPDPRTGGKDGGPVSVLFLAGRGPAGPLAMDPEVQKRLAARGYACQWVNDREPLTAEYLAQFSTVVLAGLSDFNGGGYYAPGGVTLLNTAQNVERLQEYVAAGGGLVVVPGASDSGSQMASTLNAALKPWGIRVGWEVVRDDGNALPDPVDPAKKLNYAWTRAVAQDARTAGVKALAYPTQVMRWDDIYPTLALFPEDAAWTALVRGEPGSQGMRLADKTAWGPGDAGAAPVLAAAREAGKGRVAVVGLTCLYLVTHAFAETDEKGKPVTSIGECTTGPLAGIAYAKGDGTTPSDWGVLLDNLLRWTAAAGTANGLGGAPAAWESRLSRLEADAATVPPFAVVDWKTQVPPPSWRHHSPTPSWWRGLAFYDEIADPLATRPQRMCKLLIGPRTAYSGGKGTVAEWAAAAKAAGFDMVVFAERFEAFDGANWPRFMNECDAASDAAFACLYGLDIADAYGNRFLLLGNVNFPSGGMLTPDGKALQMTVRLSLGFSQHIAVVHRLGTGKLEPELARHFQGVTVFTYAPVRQADGTTAFGLADDALAAYRWHLWNAGNPVPVTCHELDDPADVAAKGTLGFHTIVPAQDALDARRYFRQGMSHFFENPQRYFITEGPLIDEFAIFNKDLAAAFLNRDHWRAIVGARSPDPNALIREAVLFEHGAVARRWTPNATAFAQTIDGEHGYQRHFMLEVTDSLGRRALSPHLRTVTRGYFTRCADRQNWFGAAGSYTGIWPSGTHGIRYIDPRFPVGDGTEYFGGAHPLATKMSLPFASNPMTFTRYDVESRYLREVTYGMDAWAIHNTESSRTYRASAVVGKWNDIETGLGQPTGMFKHPMQLLTSVEAVFESRVAAVPAGGVFPVINGAPAGAAYTYREGERTVTGVLDGKAETLLDLPAGASVGVYLLLAPLTVTGKGELGWRAVAGQSIPAGTKWAAAYMYVPPTNTWRACLGVEGPTPWRLDLTQGKLEQVLGPATLAAEGHGVAGKLTAGGAVPYVPLRVKGLNPNWPAAVWTPRNLSYNMWQLGTSEAADVKASQTGGYLQHIGVFEGYGYATLDNTADAEFYVGNTLVATDEELRLAFTYWNAADAGLEVHNPTDREGKARVTSPAAIAGKFRVDVEVTVPAGGSVRLALPPAGR